LIAHVSSTLLLLVLENLTIFIVAGAIFVSLAFIFLIPISVKLICFKFTVCIDWQFPTLLTRNYSIK